MGCTSSFCPQSTVNASTTVIKDVDINASKNTRSITLTDEEIYLLTDMWRYLEGDMTGTGSKVFLKIFELEPETKRLFPFRNKNDDELRKDPCFKGHASRFMQMVGAAVENICNLDEGFSPLIFQLAKRHTGFPGFHLMYVNVFKNAMLQVWQEELGDNFRVEGQTVWVKLFDHILSVFKEGYLSNKNEIK